MRHLELHIIQSVPVACLNRDDLNSPKTAVFGGVQRARVSSQSWKRAIREMASNEIESSVFFQGKRSRLFIEQIKFELTKIGEDHETATALSLCVGHYLGKLDPKNESKVKTLIFLSPLEYEILAKLLFSLEHADKQKMVEAIKAVDKSNLVNDDIDEEDAQDSGKTKKTDKKITAKQFTALLAKILKKPIEQSFKNKKLELTGLSKDAADIALFGRMVASDHSLTVEAASMFSHALSTHRVDNEIDFFAAVDDLQQNDESGAGMTGTLEFNSATYYRFAAINLDMLADKDHLASLTQEERKEVVKAFIEATIKAVPVARKNSMNGNTLPLHVLGVVREKGHPIQLVNAFETPVKSGQGYSLKSIELMKSEYQKIKDTWGIDAVFEKSIPDINMNDFLDGMVEHVI